MRHRLPRPGTVDPSELELDDLRVPSRPALRLIAWRRRTGRRSAR